MTILGGLIAEDVDVLCFDEFQACLCGGQIGEERANVCVCLSEREREREGQREKERKREGEASEREKKC